MTRFIFMTGGVVSSLGKGLAVASVAALLQARGYKVCVRKIDLYLNLNPGSMSPFENGEVFVTDDGTEADVDLGHYERFTDVPVRQSDTITAGRINATIMEREKRGFYRGTTIKIVPHMTDAIKEAVTAYTGDADFVLCEIGGTVGDIESLPFIEAIRQLRHELTPAPMYLHLTLLPYLPATGELKTKPTQHGLKVLYGLGIQPDLIVCRVPDLSDPDIRGKVARDCGMPERAVVMDPDSESVYDLPLVFRGEGLDAKILTFFGLPADAAPDLSRWEGLHARRRALKSTVDIAVLTQKGNSRDMYLSVGESLKHAGLAEETWIEFHWISAPSLKKDEIPQMLEEMDGLLVPGGFGPDGAEETIAALRHAREMGLPVFGISFGMQLAVIELVRNMLGLAGAGTEEFGHPHPAVIRLPQTGAEVMRLGAQETQIVEGTLARRIYGKDLVSERHRHYYEVDPRFVDTLRSAGIVVSGISKDRGYADIIELPGHPFFMGAAFHPEFKSRPFAPHPLFQAFIRAAKEYAQ